MKTVYFLKVHGPYLKRRQLSVQRVNLVNMDTSSDFLGVYILYILLEVSIKISEFSLIHTGFTLTESWAFSFQIPCL